MVAILFALVITTNFIGSVDINGTIAMYRGARVRTRGGRGRGSMTNDTYNDYKRFDQNCFEVLSDLPDNGDIELTGEPPVNTWGSDNEGYTTVRKRQRVSTGGKSNVPSVPSNIDSEFMISEFENMNMNEKLSAIFTSLSSNQNKITHVEQKVDTIIRLNGRLNRVETVMTSYNDRMKLLEYKSIDLEARSRRNNLLFRGLPERRDEDCRRVICSFLEDKLSIDELPSIERAHRLGRFNPAKGPRPIIVAFSFFKDTEDILSNARSLKGTPFGISRDYPPEITRARQALWPRLKEARENRFNHVTIGYPAKLIVNGAIICNLFPDWDAVMKGSRIPVPRFDDAQPLRQDIMARPSSYAAAVATSPTVNARQSGIQDNEAAIHNVSQTNSSSNSIELMETQDIVSSQRSSSLLTDVAARIDPSTNCETECNKNYDDNQQNIRESNEPYVPEGQNQSADGNHAEDYLEFPTLRADNVTEAILSKHGVDYDHTAPNCSTQADGQSKESLTQPSSTNTHTLPVRNGAVSDLSLSPRSLADTLLCQARSESTMAEPGQQNLQNQQASSRASRSRSTGPINRISRSESRTRPANNSTQKLDKKGCNSRKVEKKT